MKKPIALLIIVTFLLSAIILTLPQEISGDALETPTRQPVSFYMYGPGDNGNMTTLAPTSETDEEEDCPQNGNMQPQQSTVGTWRTEPVTKRMNFTGDIEVNLWAKGDVRDVQFTFRISRSGNNPTSITTNSADTESTPKLFNGSDFVSLSLSSGDYIEVEIVFNGGETDVIQGPNKQATIVYGSIDHPSGIIGPCDAVYFDYDEEDITVNDDNADDDKETLIVIATIRDGLGVEDMATIGFEARTNDFVGQSYSEPRVIEEGADFYTVEFKWFFADDNAYSGGYEINLTMTDQSGNMWYKTHTAHIVYNPRPKIDFSVSDTDIVVDPNPVYEKMNGYINVTVHCYGEDAIDGLMPIVFIEVTGPDGAKTPYVRRVTINTGADAIAQVKYFFNFTGMYTIKAIVNPSEASMYYIEENDAKNADANNEGTTTIEVGVEPKDDDDDEWYEEIQHDIEDEPMYQGAIVAAIVVIIVAVFLVMRRRREYDEYEDEYDFE